MKMLSRDDILNVNDIAVEELPVPEWGGSVFVKTLTAEERDLIEAQLVKINPNNGATASIKMDKLRALCAFYGICDAEGKRIFTNTKDIDLLAKKSAAALDRVVSKVQAMAAMSPADIASLVDDLKNDQPAALPTV